MRTKIFSHFTFFICFILIVLSINGLFSSEMESLQDSVDSRDYKKAIKIQYAIIEQAPQNEKGEKIKELALIFLKDQDQEQAFESFLKALSLTKTTVENPLPYDEVEYKKAFSIYLNPSSKSTQATAKSLITTLIPILDAKPEQYLLDYFVAIAYANLGKYEQFFNHFYRAYKFYPSHYLAYKTKAVLYIKLSERTRGYEEKEVKRQLIRENLLLALQKEPLDTAIYKLLISFSSQEIKKDQVQLCLNKIINGNIMIPRSELMFYVMEAVDMGDSELAQRFITLSKEWYPQSRIVASTQNYLDAHK